MKALTVHQPRASLIALGIKTIETRGQRTSHRGRLAIHAGKTDAFMAGQYGRGSIDGSDELWRLRDNVLDPEADGPGYDVIGTAPLGAIVGSVELTGSVPIVETRAPLPESWIRHIAPMLNGGLCLWTAEPPSWRHDDIEDQEPLGDFTPGRWGWLLADAKPTTERCPWCGGHGHICRGCDSCDGSPGVGHDVATCPVCDGAGRCDPIPARGMPGMWEWDYRDGGGP